MSLLHSYYLYPFRGTCGAIDLKDAYLIGETSLDSSAEDYDEDLVNFFLNNLKKCLIDNKILHFIPLKRASIESNERGITLCYYHNELAHNIVYGNLPEWINMPNEKILADLEKLYHSHGLDGWTDPLSNTVLD